MGQKPVPWHHAHDGIQRWELFYHRTTGAPSLSQHGWAQGAVGRNPEEIKLMAGDSPTLPGHGGTEAFYEGKQQAIEDLTSGGDMPSDPYEFFIKGASLVHHLQKRLPADGSHCGAMPHPKDLARYGGKVKTEFVGKRT
jgi:hypothetical protein